MTPIEALQAIDSDIEAFDNVCIAREYTDTGEVWDMLRNFREFVSATLAKDYAEGGGE